MTNQFSYTEKKSDNKKPFVDSIRVIRQYDQYPDLSYLEQDYNDVTDIKEREKYLQQDKERLESYYNDNWFMMGIYAKTTIHIPLGLIGYSMTNDFLMIQIKSGGIWGIESDSDDDYIKSEIDSQIEEIKKILKVLNVEISDNLEIINDGEISY